jgi:hypothetical protein
MEKYSFTKTPVDIDRLENEIQLSEITVALDHASTLGSALDVYFKAALSAGEQDVLAALVTAHTGEPLAPEDVVQQVTGYVTPTTPKNEYSLVPYGALHVHIDSSNQLAELTLSNKSGSTYNYTCTKTPKFFDCLFADHSARRDGVESVDGGSLTTFYGVFENGVVTLSQPVDIDFPFPGDEPFYHLWGCYISAKDFGEDDLVRLQIVDKDGVGVALGWYTQAEFDAMGQLYVVKEYDECWVGHMEKLTRMMTPDGSPGIIPAGLYARAKYYPKDVAKTDIKVWMDYIITVKDG